MQDSFWVILYRFILMFLGNMLIGTIYKFQVLRSSGVASHNLVRETCLLSTFFELPLHMFLSLGQFQIPDLVF